MVAFALTLLVGIVCVLIGFANRRGNISMLHDYHINRVSEEDRLPLGRRVGIGMIVVGCAICLFSVLSVISILMEREIFVVVATGIMLLGMAVGIGIVIHALKKYNKGVF